MYFADELGSRGTLGSFTNYSADHLDILFWMFMDIRARDLALVGKGGKGRGGKTYKMEDWKVKNVTTIFKKWSRRDPGSYRTASLTVSQAND